MPIRFIFSKSKKIEELCVFATLKEEELSFQCMSPKGEKRKQGESMYFMGRCTCFNLDSEYLGVC